MRKLDKFLDNIWKILIVYAAFILVFTVLFSTVLMLTQIPSGSMESTIMTGDVVVASRYGIELDDIKRYDILVFEPPIDEESLYIKRVIGLPGEVIEVKDGQVYADGAELDNAFTNGMQNCNGDGIWEVPKGCLFFLGDNRNNSADSRFWEDAFVPIENVEAKAQWVVFPLSHFGSLSYDGSRTGAFESDPPEEAESERELPPSFEPKRSVVLSP